MKNKRNGKLNKIDMSRVEPLKVSPVIKAARWGFLILGMMKGSWRLHSLREYEKTAGVIRHKQVSQKHAEEKARMKQKTSSEIKDVALQFEVTDFPPGWDDSF